MFYAKNNVLFFPLNFSKDTNRNWKTASSYHLFLQAVASPTPPGESRQVEEHWMLMGHPQEWDAAACAAILSKAAFRDTAWDSLGPPNPVVQPLTGRSTSAPMLRHLWAQFLVSRLPCVAFPDREENGGQITLCWCSRYAESEEKREIFII